MRTWKDEGEMMQQPRHLLDRLMLCVTLTKAGREEGNSSLRVLCVHGVQACVCMCMRVHVRACRHRGGIKVGRCFMKLLVAGGKCLFICTELRSLGAAGGRFAVGQAL